MGATRPLAMTFSFVPIGRIPLGDVYAVHNGSEILAYDGDRKTFIQVRLLP